MRIEGEKGKGSDTYIDSSGIIIIGPTSWIRPRRREEDKATEAGFQKVTLNNQSNVEH